MSPLFKYKLSIKGIHIHWLVYAVFCIIIFSLTKGMLINQYQLTPPAEIQEILFWILGVLWLIWTIIIAIAGFNDDIDNEPLFKKTYIERPKGIVIDLLQREDGWFAIRAKLGNWVRYYNNDYSFGEIKTDFKSFVPNWFTANKTKAEDYYRRLVSLHGESDETDYTVIKTNKLEYSHERAKMLYGLLKQADEKGENPELILKQLELLHRQ